MAPKAEKKEGAEAGDKKKKAEEEDEPIDDETARKIGDCRFYEDEYPKVDDVVMVVVRRVADMGAYVQLMEYNGIEGLILSSELSKRRIRSIQKLVRVGKIEAVKVLRLDREKGFIDLSKKVVRPEEITGCEEHYSKSKAVQSVMRHLAMSTGKTLTEVCESVSWPLYKKYGHAYDAFQMAVKGEEDIFAEMPEITADVKEKLIENIKRKLTPQALRMRSRVEVCCYEYAGIDAVKAALLKGCEASTPDAEVKIRLIAPPQYAVITTCLEKQEGVKVLTKAMELIEEAILAEKGQFAIKAKAEVVGGEDDDTDAGESGDSGDSGSDTESDQDETMGDANFDEADFKKGGDEED